MLAFTPFLLNKPQWGYMALLLPWGIVNSRVNPFSQIFDGFMVRCLVVYSGSAAQIPAFYMDTSHLFSAPHPRLAPPSLAQQQGYQPGLSQVRIHSANMQGTGNVLMVIKTRTGVDRGVVGCECPVLSLMFLPLSLSTLQPTAVQQIPIPIYAPLQGQPQHQHQHQHTHQAQLGLGTGPPVSQPQDLFSSSLQPYR